MKKNLLKVAFAIILLATTNSFAQTTEELKAEREVIKKELRSEKTIERQKKIEKLETPKASGVSTIDDLATNSSSLLNSTKKLNTQIPELYKRSIGETVDGVTDVTTKKPTIEELTDVSKTILQQITVAENNAKTVEEVAGDVKKANPLAAGKALKSLNFSKDVLALTLPELKNNLVVIKNLISTVSSSNNL